MPCSTAIYVDENLKFGVYSGNMDIPTAGPNELLIEPEYSGANPADVKHSTLLGIYPTRLGYDFCGKVLQTGPVSAIQIRDKYGAHQTYTICPEDMAFSVPASLLYHHALCLSVVTMTAADAVYNHMKFPLPQDIQQQSSSHNANGPLLIWGASSSVGLFAVQFARASGVTPIIVTASPERHPLLLRLGATHCFDYKSATVIPDIMTLLKAYGHEGAPSALDAVCSPGCAEATASCVSSENGILVSVEFQRDLRFRMATGIMNADVTMKPVHFPHPLTTRARPEDNATAWNVLKWAAANYGTGFRFPSVEVFEGSAEDALTELENLARIGRGFGKLVLKHPFV